MLLLALTALVLRLPFMNWVILVPVFGVISGAERWRHFAGRSERLMLLCGLALSLVCPLLAILLLFDSGVQGVMNASATSLSMMIRSPAVPSFRVRRRASGRSARLSPCCFSRCRARSARPVAAAACRRRICGCRAWRHWLVVQPLEAGQPEFHQMRLIRYDYGRVTLPLPCYRSLSYPLAPKQEHAHGE